MHLINQLKRLNFKVILSLILILFLGSFLRFYKIEERTHFDADQEELAVKSAEILRGDIVLLGPKTSVGSFSIGPLFTYFWALFSWPLEGDPVAGAYLSATLGVLVILGFYLLGKFLFGSKIGLILATIVALSVNFIRWDQNPWAPSLFFLAEIILLAGIYLSTKKPVGFPIAVLGIMLGFHSHFGIFLSLFAIVIFWVFYRSKFTKKYFLISLVIVLFGLLPNIIFDVTHNFENIKRLFDTLNNNSETGASVSKIFLSLSNSTVRMIYPHFSSITTRIVFLTVIIFGFLLFWKDQKNRMLIALLLISIIVPALIFIPYKSNFSEYYLMMTIPPFILLVGYFLSKLSKVLFSVGLGIILLMSLYPLPKFIKDKVALNLKAKKSAVLLINQIAGKTGYGVSLSTQLGYNFGYKYIFDYYGMSPDIPPKIGEVNTMTIVVPSNYEGIKAKTEFNGVGVLWEGPMFQNRTNNI